MTKQEMLDKMKSLKEEVENFDKEIYENTEMTGDQLQRIDYLVEEVKCDFDNLISNMEDIMCEEFEEYFDDEIPSNVGE